MSNIDKTAQYFDTMLSVGILITAFAVFIMVIGLIQCLIEFVNRDSDE